MAQGSISNISKIMLGMLLGLICATAVVRGGSPGEWTVGDDKGWSFGVSNWPTNKAIHAGEVLVFKYDPNSHDVVEVDEDAYNACQASDGARRYTTGDDHVRLRAGKNFFICSKPGHCEQGMKISVFGE